MPKKNKKNKKRKRNKNNRGGSGVKSNEEEERKKEPQVNFKDVELKDFDLNDNSCIDEWDQAVMMSDIKSEAIGQIGGILVENFQRFFDAQIASLEEGVEADKLRSGFARDIKRIEGLLVGGELVSSLDIGKGFEAGSLDKVKELFSNFADAYGKTVEMNKQLKKRHLFIQYENEEEEEAIAAPAQQGSSKNGNVVHLAEAERRIYKGEIEDLEEKIKHFRTISQSLDTFFKEEQFDLPFHRTTLDLDDGLIREFDTNKVDQNLKTISEQFSRINKLISDTKYKVQTLVDPDYEDMSYPDITNFSEREAASEYILSKFKDLRQKFSMIHRSVFDYKFDEIEVGQEGEEGLEVSHLTGTDMDESIINEGDEMKKKSKLILRNLKDLESAGNLEEDFHSFLDYIKGLEICSFSQGSNLPIELYNCSFKTQLRLEATLQSETEELTKTINEQQEELDEAKSKLNEILPKIALNNQALAELKDKIDELNHHLDNMSAISSDSDAETLKVINAEIKEKEDKVEELRSEGKKLNRSKTHLQQEIRSFDYLINGHKEDLIQLKKRTNITGKCFRSLLSVIEFHIRRLDLHKKFKTPFDKKEIFNHLYTKKSLEDGKMIEKLGLRIENLKKENENLKKEIDGTKATAKENGDLKISLARLKLEVDSLTSQVLDLEGKVAKEKAENQADKELIEKQSENIDILSIQLAQTQVMVKEAKIEIEELNLIKTQMQEDMLLEANRMNKIHQENQERIAAIREELNQQR